MERGAGLGQTRKDQLHLLVMEPHVESGHEMPSSRIHRTEPWILETERCLQIVHGFRDGLKLGTSPLKLRDHGRSRLRAGLHRHNGSRGR